MARRYVGIPVPGTGGGMVRLADSSPGACARCPCALVGFRFEGVTGWLCIACDARQVADLDVAGARLSDCPDGDHHA